LNSEPWRNLPIYIIKISLVVPFKKIHVNFQIGLIEHRWFSREAFGFFDSGCSDRLHHEEIIGDEWQMKNNMLKGKMTTLNSSM
jgi:hypothetical protein